LADGCAAGSGGGVALTEPAAAGCEDASELLGLAVVTVSGVCALAEGRDAGRAVGRGAAAGVLERSAPSAGGSAPAPG